MELKDFVVTPMVLFIVYILAYTIRPKVTDHNTKRYFIPALTVKIVGAIAMGLLYQFYYGGGDTFSFYTHGSSHIWEAFLDSPIKGMKLIFANGEFESSTFSYSSKIWFYKDPPSYFIVRLAAVIGLITFNTYSAIACLFAVIGFVGVWALYQVFYQEERKIHAPLALAVLFIPSVFFWGSGLMKDTLTLAALGWATFGFYSCFFRKKRVILNLGIMLIAFYVLYEVKLYILLVLVPSFIIWIFFSRFYQVPSRVLQILILPFVVATVVGLSYLAVLSIGEESKKYSLNKLTETARITAYDIRFYTGRSAGSGYSLGEFDGSVLNMIKLAPSAVNVTLFRPYLWEVNSLVMLLAAFESLLILALSVVVIFKVRFEGLRLMMTDPFILFCMIFSLVFAFAVGISTYNFGTLMRYKIPLMPFFVSALFLLYFRSKRDRKLAEFEATE